MRRNGRISHNRWLPPPVDVVKLNFNGAICSKNKRAGIGMVVRDTNGLVLAYCAKPVPQPYKAAEVESLAAATALSFATELDFRWVILEGDLMEVIQALRENDQSLTPMGLLLEDVRMLSQQFVQLLYSHTKRDGNSVAHSLAKYALSIPNFVA